MAAIEAHRIERDRSTEQDKLMYKGRCVYQIKESDIGKALLWYIDCTSCRKKAIIRVSDLLGRIMACDVGKLIYATTDNPDSRVVYQVENQDQVERRLKRGVYGEKSLKRR